MELKRSSSIKSDISESRGVYGLLNWIASFFGLGKSQAEIERAKKKARAAFYDDNQAWWKAHRGKGEAERIGIQEGEQYPRAEKNLAALSWGKWAPSDRSGGKFEHVEGLGFIEVSEKEEVSKKERDYSSPAPRDSKLDRSGGRYVVDRINGTARKLSSPNPTRRVGRSF